MSYYKYLIICVVFFLQPAQGEEPMTIRVGLSPNVWFYQTAVIKGRNWDIENGFSLEIIRFPGPAQNLQAFIGGHTDIMNNNVAAAFLAKNKVGSVRVFASSMSGDSILMGRGEFSTSLDSKDAVKQLKKVCAEKGKINLVTNPRGSLSDLNIKLWLSKNYLNYSECINFIYAADQGQLISIFLNKNADLVSAFSPLQIVFRNKDRSVGEFLAAREIGQPQAGGVFAIKQEYYLKHLNHIEKLKLLIEKATLELKNNPEESAVYVDKFINQGLVSQADLIQAIKDASPYLAASPRQFENSSREIFEIMKADGYLNDKLDIGDLWQ